MPTWDLEQFHFADWPGDRRHQPLVQTEARIPFNPNIHVNQIAQVRIRDYSNPRAIVVPPRLYRPMRKESMGVCRYRERKRR